MGVHKNVRIKTRNFKIRLRIMFGMLTMPNLRTSGNREREREISAAEIMTKTTNMRILVYIISDTMAILYLGTLRQLSNRTSTSAWCGNGQC